MCSRRFTSRTLQSPALIYGGASRSPYSLSLCRGSRPFFLLLLWSSWKKTRYQNFAYSILPFVPISKWVSIYKVQRDVVRRLAKGMKSSRQDKGEGTKDMLKGVAKEATGTLRGDDAKRARGLSDQRKGAVKKKKGELKDRLE